MYHLEARGEVKIDRTVFDRLSSRQKITVRLLPSLPCLCPGAVCQLRFLGILTHAVLLQYGTELLAGGSISHSCGCVFEYVRSERLEGTITTARAIARASGRIPTRLRTRGN